MALLAFPALRSAAGVVLTATNATVPSLTGRTWGEPFGALPGCVVEVNVTVEPPDALAYIMVFGSGSNDRADAGLSGGAVTAAQVCSFPSLLRFEVGGSRNFRTFAGGLDRKDILHMRIINCGGKDVSIRGSASITNTVLGPSFQHFSADATGLIATYLFETVAHGLIAVGYILWALAIAGLRRSPRAALAVVRWTGFRDPSASLVMLKEVEEDSGMELGRKYLGMRSVNILLAVLLWVRFIELCSYNAYYAEFGLTGRVSDALTKQANGVALLTNGVLSGTLFALSGGWGYFTSADPDRLELALSTLYAVLYIVLIGLRTNCSEAATMAAPIAGVVACDAVDIAEYVIRSLCLLGGVFNINFHLTTLRMRLAAAGPDVVWAPNTGAVYAHANRMRIYRRIFLAYLILPPVLYIVRLQSFTWEYGWVNNLLAEAAILATYAILATLFAVPAPGLYAGSMTALRMGLRDTRGVVDDSGEVADDADAPSARTVQDLGELLSFRSSSSAGQPPSRTRGAMAPARSDTSIRQRMDAGPSLRIPAPALGSMEDMELTSVQDAFRGTGPLMRGTTSPPFR
jgi:hypothetical protein